MATTKPGPNPERMGVVMFEVFCPEHGTRVLLTITRIEKLWNTPAGIIVDWRCWCGTAGRLYKTNGRPPADVAA